MCSGTLIVSLVAAVVGTGLTFIMAQKVADMFNSNGPPVIRNGMSGQSVSTISGTIAGLGETEVG
jgi:hypothetical protein